MWIIIYKLILNLSAVRGTHEVPGQPSPAGHHIHIRCLKADVWLISTPQSTQIMETKKTWEYVSLRAYPWFQAFALPLYEDKQRKPAHASDYIYTYTTAWSIPEWRNERTTDIWIHGLLPSHIYAKSVHLSWGVHLIIYIKGNDSRREI